MDVESKRESHPLPVNQWGQTRADLARMRLRQRLAIGVTAATLIAVAAVVKPENFFSSPLFRLGTGIAPGSRPAPWNKELREEPDFLCLLVIGGLRADYAGFGNEPSGESPALERFASQATRFESTCAQASNPMVSMKSMLTGRYPANLILTKTGADQRSLMGIDDSHSFMQGTFDQVSTELGPWLEGEGYQVTAYSDADWAQDPLSFGEAFRAPEQPWTSSLEQGKRWVQSLSQAELHERRALILHVEELLPEGTSAQGSRAAYAHALKRLDSDLGQLFRALERRRLWKRGLVILTSDHGTSLGERGMVGHGELYLEQLMVPLGIKFPESWRVPPRSYEGGVELVDLFPTIQAMCAETPEELDGRSMLPIAFRGKPGRQLLIAQTSFGPQEANPTTRSAIEPKRWQVIQDARGDGLLFYSLEPDPDALQPVRPGNLKVPSFVTRLFTQRSVD